MNTRQKYIAFMTIFRRDLKRTFRLWIQTFLPSVVTTVLYFLIFGSFIGSQIKSVGGVSYMSFIVPGLVMMAVLNNAFSGTLFSFYFMKFQKTIEEILVSPMPVWLVTASYVAGAVARGVIVGAIVFLSAFFFETIPVAHPFAALFVTILTATLFALFGLVNAIYAKTFDGLNIVTTFVLMPLTYLGGVFYSVKLLPPVWQTISHFNPILYMINGFRFSVLGISDISFATCILVLVLSIFVAFGWVVYLFKTGRGLKS